MVDSSTNAPDYPESKQRRLLEFRLLHHYNTRTSLTLNLIPPGSTESNPLELWLTDVPILAFDNDALLNIMCAIAALHTANCNP